MRVRLGTKLVDILLELIFILLCFNIYKLQFNIFTIYIYIVFLGVTYTPTTSLFFVPKNIYIYKLTSLFGVMDQPADRKPLNGGCNAI